MSNLVNTTRREVIGRILPNPRGEWELKVEYNRLDFVLFNGSGYVALKGNVDILPNISAETWLKIVDRGEKGEKGDTGPAGDFTFMGEWNEKETYSKYSVVQYNGDAWTCVTDFTTGVVPGYIPSEDDEDVDLNTWKPSWELMVKGVDYRYENGEITLLDHGQVKGVRTFIESVYDENNNNLSDILANMQSQIDECKRRLDKYNL